MCPLGQTAKWTGAGDTNDAGRLPLRGLVAARERDSPTRLAARFLGRVSTGFYSAGRDSEPPPTWENVGMPIFFNHSPDGGQALPLTASNRCSSHCSGDNYPGWIGAAMELLGGPQDQLLHPVYRLVELFAWIDFLRITSIGQQMTQRARAASSGLARIAYLPIRRRHVTHPPQQSTSITSTRNHQHCTYGCLCDRSPSSRRRDANRRYPCLVDTAARTVGILSLQQP